MFKNYFYLKRNIKELAEKIVGLKVYEIFTQEKNKLHLLTPANGLPFQHLVISINPQFPFLQLKAEHHKAKKNVINFLDKNLPQKFTSFEIANNDRIIKISFENFQLIILIRGSKSNILFLSDKFDSFSFKKLDNLDEVIQEISKTNFILPGDQINLNFEEAELKLLRKKIPIIPKEALEEIELRTSASFLTSPDVLKSILSEIELQQIAVGFNPISERVRFLPGSFAERNKLIHEQCFTTYSQALQNYISLYFRIKKKNELKKKAAKFLDRELIKLSNKLNNLKVRIDNGSKEKLYNKIGNLLLINRNKLKKGMGEIELTDFETNEKIKISLDKKISPQQNIDKYFEKSYDEKINYGKSIELYKTAKEKYETLFIKKNLLDKSDNLEEIQSIAKELNTGISKKMDIKEKKIKFRHFLIDEKYNCYVGRDSKENDYLSIKFAKQNDYWFHARGLPGSHVVLKNDNPKETVPKNILKKAAAIAAYYSKGKTAGLIPVSYTFAKFVRKKKGMEPGKVLISKEKVLLVKPEIPKNAEQVYE